MTENTIALLFPGQGSQAVGMGKELAEKYPVARQTFEEADDALGYNLSRLCFDGPEDQLRMTEITQPAILTVSIAALRVLETRMPKPGRSDIVVAVLVVHRSRLMQAHGMTGRRYAGKVQQVITGAIVSRRRR